ncbi:hypothetical protein [Fluviicola sp.]|uniref:hypothetical protein n=1 Tax=Fluviicola sp. TaxID=1917219 RepID=UPI0031D1071A
MKKIAGIALNIALITVLAACGKTTKGKLVNDWKVVSSFEEQEFRNANDEHTVNTLTTTDNEVTSSTFYHPPTGPEVTNSQTGTLNAYEFLIKKDGTWSSVREIAFGSGASSSVSRIEQSGTWSFLKKNKSDDFKKNERVHFNVLNSKEVETSSSGGTVVSSSSAVNTYATGEKVLVYAIKTSKKDELEIELEKNSAFTNNSGTSTNSLIQKLTLKGK